MTTIFSDFNQIRDDLEKNAPPYIYKYRTWDDENHKSLLTEQEAYFAHPFDLNDPLDVRPDTKFNVEEFYDIKFFEKLRLGAKEKFPELNAFQQEARAKQQWELIKHDPNIVIRNLEEYATKRENYDHIGIFSTSTTDLSQELWEKYANAFQGYCIGFKTVPFYEGLYNRIKCGFMEVDYSDKQFEYRFLAGNESFEKNRLIYLQKRLRFKKRFWGYENEFRFLTSGVGLTIDENGPIERIQKFKRSDVTEIILGHKISTESKNEILEVIKEQYKGSLQIFKTGLSNGQLIKSPM